VEAATTTAPAAAGTKDEAGKRSRKVTAEVEKTEE
jgi:hypothetical protein